VIRKELFTSEMKGNKMASEFALVPEEEIVVQLVEIVDSLCDISQNTWQAIEWLAKACY